MKKITYKSISSALTNKQLKNILGGSGGGGSCGDGSGYEYVFAAWCSSGLHTIKANSMNEIYDKFADLCPAGGQLMRC